MPVDGANKIRGKFLLRSQFYQFHVQILVTSLEYMLFHEYHFLSNNISIQKIQ